MAIVLYILLILAEHHGQVIFGGVPVPGVTVTATQGDKKFVAITDTQGLYTFPELTDGPFTIQVEMSGFSSIKQEVNVISAELELKMLPIGEMRAEVVHAAAPPPASASSPAVQPASGSTPAASAANARPAAAGQRGQPPAQTGFQRTEVNASSNASSTPPADDAPPTTGAFANLSPEELNQRADGFLINGQVNNGAASPFAQAAQFGNNRRSRPLYTGGFAFAVENSALDARSYSLTGQDTARPAFNHFNGSFNIGGPLKIPRLIKNNAPTFFFGYSRTQNRNAVTATGRMPTAAERNGDFSQSVNPLGQPVQIIDPATGSMRVPFTGNVIPPERISSQARALMNLFPLPNFTDSARYNYQVPLIDGQHSDGVQGPLNKSINQRNQIGGNVDIRIRGAMARVFSISSIRLGSFGINAAANWTTRPTQRFRRRSGYQFSRQATRVTPYFANKINVSGSAGIGGNNQDAPNWGPPTLNFSGGTSALSDVQYSFNRTQNNTVGLNAFWNRGRHNVTFGADMRRAQVNVLSQQDARGTFTFTGAAAGSDFAGFLLGIPDASSIAFGNADKYFRQRFFNAFVTDDWRVNGAVTINAGARWEYETPISAGRLVNLNIAPGFASVAPILGNSLIRSDGFGVQPRLSFAWRPVASSFAAATESVATEYQVVRRRWRSSRLFRRASVQNTPANPLSLANGFTTAQGVTATTFAVDPISSGLRPDLAAISPARCRRRYK
jgi:hypothetical protein